jgi:uncharacterized membrane protein (DUF4010 family)
MEITVNPANQKLILDIVFSLLLGLIIGLEREHRTKKEVFAGIRTFPLISILGTLSAFIYDNYWDGVFYVVLGGIILFGLLNFYLEYSKDIGITTEIAVLITYFIGILIYYGYYYTAAFLTIFTTILLALKYTLEGFAKQLSQEDIIAFLKFAVVSVVIFPLLPDKYYGPFNAFNPRDIWKMVVIVSALDFVGYVLIRWKGAKSISLNGFVGGLISSTAVSYELAKLSKRYPFLSFSTFNGIVIAWTIMNFRVLILSFIVYPKVSFNLLFPLIVLSIIYAGVLSYNFYKNKNVFKKESKEEMEFQNPFEISSALQFGLIYALILFSVKALQHYMGHTGIFIASFVSGVIDVDAITLSLSNLAKTDISISLAAKAILLAVISNSIFKYAYIAIFGNSFLRKNMLWILLITILFLGIFMFF